MNHPIHLLIPMSGQGKRYQAAGYSQPKPLIPVSGIPMIERVLSNFPQNWPSHFVMAQNHRDSGLTQLLHSLRPQGTQHFIQPHTRGPGQAILAGLAAIPDDDAVFVSYCDYGMVWDSAQFEQLARNSDCDACVISYRGFHPHYLGPTKYAYSRLEGENIVEVREKGSFTDNRESEYASSGGYYFKSARLLRDALAFQQENNLELNGELYTSLTVEALLRMKADARVRVFEIQRFFQWGTPNDLRTFEYWERTFHAYNQLPRKRPTVEQVLMPMAGLGSRFNSITALPKPLISVNGEPMFKAALNSLPEAKSKTVVVTLHEIAACITPADLEIATLQQTPSGQALSTQAGIHLLDSEKEILISSCDHGIVLDPELWNRFHEAPDCDAAIFTIRGFCAADLKPTAYAYVVPQKDDREQAAPLVEAVSVKKPVSPSPSADHLLVGTFWFRSAEVLKNGIEELQKRDIRVNGELYLDSVFEVLIAQGLRVRMIPLNGYICWGDPDSLSEAIYWQETFTGKSFCERTKFPGLPTGKTS